MDNDYLMTVLTREDLAHGGKTRLNEMTDVFMGGKSLWVRVTLASIIPKFNLISVQLTYG